MTPNKLPPPNENDKLTQYCAGHVMRFIRNECDKYQEYAVLLESVERTEEEIEIGFTFGRDRYYLRARADDLLRLILGEPQ